MCRNEHRCSVSPLYSIDVPPPLLQDFPNDAAARKLIPGAYDQNTPTQRQPGTMGGAPFGSTDMPVGASTMSAATIAERRKEGGGGTVHIRNESWYTLLSRCFHSVSLGSHTPARVVAGRGCRPRHIS
jgi:hypothetical protein